MNKSALDDYQYFYYVYEFETFGAMTFVERSGLLYRLLYGIHEYAYKYIETDLILEAKKQVTEFFRGERKTFTVPYVLEIDGFTGKVLRKIMKIPYGETSSYSDMGSYFGNWEGEGSIGRATTMSPLALIIPCHRVVGNNGLIGSFNADITTKKALLNLERRVVENEQIRALKKSTNR